MFLSKGIVLETHLRKASSKGLYNGNHHFFTFLLDEVLHYSVGKSANLDSNFNNAANCYRLDGLCINGSLLGILEPISINLIAKMCNINYVRNHQNSVLPWANKYLKEYLKARALI